MYFSFGTLDVCYGGVAESSLYSSALILYDSIDLCTSAIDPDQIVGCPIATLNIWDDLVGAKVIDTRLTDQEANWRF